MNINIRKKWKGFLNGFLPGKMMDQSKEMLCVEDPGASDADDMGEQKDGPIHANRSQAKDRLVFLSGYYLIVALLCVMFWSGSCSMKEENTVQEHAKEQESETAEMISVSRITETERQNKALMMTEKLTEKFTEKLTEKPEEQTEENWKETIFGNDLQQVSDAQLFVSGLSKSEKRKLQFRESDFVKAAGSFFQDQRIDVRTVEFQKQISCSSADGIAYMASLPGHDTLLLSVVFYPEFPGKYIMSLIETDMEEKQESGAQEPQPRQPAETQTPETIPPSAQTSAEGDEPDRYDATKLSVNAVPSTLANYLDNCYELQYSLYGFLYKNGDRDISSASVKDYTIDPDARTATMKITLEDGKEVTGTYKKDSNSYSYYF